MSLIAAKIDGNIELVDFSSELADIPKTLNIIDTKRFIDIYNVICEENEKQTIGSWASLYKTISRKYGKRQHNHLVLNQVTIQDMQTFFQNGNVVSKKFGSLSMERFKSEKK